MRRDPDLLKGAGLMGLSTLTGTWGVRAAHAVPKRTRLDAPLARGGEMFVHLFLVLGAAIWLASRIARRVHLRPMVSRCVRVAGWTLVLAFVLANARHSGTAGHGRDLFLAATTTVVPIWPMVVGGLLFDLVLLLFYKGFPKPPEGFDVPTGAACAGLYGGLLPVAFVGALALANFGAEFFAPPLFEALAFDSVWTIPIVVLATPVALVWIVAAEIRGL